jgi:mycoredoxin
MNLAIHIYTTSWCGDCRRARQFLKEHRLPFEDTDIEENAGAAEFVMQANNGKRKVPTFDVNGRVFSCSPFDAEKVARELGIEI